MSRGNLGKLSTTFEENKMSIDLLFYIVAAVCFGLAAFGIAARVNLVALGLLAWVLTNIV